MLTLVRHPQVLLPKGICYGSADVPLKPGWESWADALSGYLSRVFPEGYSIWSSPLQRCQIPANYISQEPVQLRPDWQEIHFGDWEMKAWEDIPAGELNPWMEAFVHTNPPQGESFLELSDRVGASLDSLQESMTDRPVVLITHAGPIRAALCRVSSRPLADAFSLPVDYGHLYQLSYRQGQWEIMKENVLPKA
ncbi:alpha-ribazole phosphatase family protein [Pontibacter sp. G13]|uniref:alpha-ribazole phosphatase family protein n=1 Tax=Pontibacter sp. G13 TaxID=3074898 RepID=UPI00288BFC12|nr:alpha-ribazole phosphatase family protein [Pontibacter sp. G13]WNJ18193.1 alpha-ribazole phosphatase family protein [Pontibacter sp. G13]